jgi:hypothetical protein
MEKKDLKVLEIDDADDIISVNDRKRLGEVKKKYPNMEIIVGKVTPEDKPVPLNLLQMEHDRQVIFDAATESVLGKRIDTLDKGSHFPIGGVMFIVGFLTGVGACFFVYNI